LLVAPSGLFAEWLGWSVFFSCCALVAVPGLALLIYLRGWISGSAVARG
jgi:PAT family beta-lactamase induction signal transducer AmpG